MSKTTFRKIGEGVAWTSFSSVAVKIIGILYIILVLNSVTVAEFGLIELAMSLIPLLAIFNLAGIQPVMIADLVSLKAEKKFEEMRYVFSAFISIRLLLGVIAFALLNVGVVLFSDFPSEALLMVKILSFVFIAGPIRAVVFLIFNVNHRFDYLAQIRLLEELLKLVLVYFFLTKFDLGPLGVILAFVLTDFFVTIIYVPSALIGAKTALNNRFLCFTGFADPFFVVKHHAKWSIFQSTLHQAGQNIRPWILQFFLGTQAVGIYATATGLYQHTVSLIPIARVVSPIIPEFKNYPKKLVQLLNSAVRYQLLLLFLTVIGTLLTLPFLIKWYFPSYEEAFPLFLLLSLAMIPDSFSRIYESAFHAFRLQRNLFWANLFKMIMIITLLPVLILQFGIYGVAIEFFVTTVIYSVSRFSVLKRKLVDLNFSFKSLFTFSEVDKIVYTKFCVFVKSYVPSIIVEKK